jgi:arsenical pump membrane protein
MAAVLTRPRRLPESLAAAVGAVVMLLLGLLTPIQAGMALLQQWNLFLFFCGLMTISGLADAAGFFEAAGAVAAGAARGSSRLLLVTVFAAGAVITAFLSNDATALILTPVVYAVVTRLRLPPMPYLFATTFVADTASMTLPVSNPINVLVIDRLHLGLAVYWSHLLGPALAVVVLNALLFLLVYRRHLAQRFEFDWRRALARSVPNRVHLRLVCAGLAVIAIAYVAGSAAGVPVGPIALGGAGLLAVLSLAAGRFDAGRVREHLSLSLLLYVAGLLVLVRGLEASGLTAALVGRLAGLARGEAGAASAGLIGSAVAANVVNNVPATLIFLSGSAHLGGLRLPFLMGTVAGADLGPNLTPVGSLSTMLWLVAVRRRGLNVSALDYLRVGAMVTPALLLAAGLVLVATFGP